MSSNLNTVLGDCGRLAEQLVEEIKNYRSARVLSNQTAESLEKLCLALRETHERILPFTEVFSRRILIGLGGLLVINCGLLLTILVMFFLR